MGIEQISENMLGFGAIGLALMIAWRALGLVSFKWMGRQEDNKMDVVYKYAVNNEPAMRKIRNGVGSGVFSCIWKDRDEVVNHVSAIKELTLAVNTLTREIRKQNGT